MVVDFSVAAVHIRGSLDGGARGQEFPARGEVQSDFLPNIVHINMGKNLGVRNRNVHILPPLNVYPSCPKTDSSPSVFLSGTRRVSFINSTHCA